MAVGSTVDAFSSSWGVIMHSCPWCEITSVTDTVAHAILGCTHRHSVHIRNKHLPKLHRIMNTVYHPWCAMYNNATTLDRQAALILHAADFIDKEVNILDVVRILLNWVVEIQKHHPIIKQRMAGRPITSIGRTPPAPKRKSSSRFRGVFTRTNKRTHITTYQVEIKYRAKRYHIGTFDDEIAAAKAHDAWLKNNASSTELSRRRNFFPSGVERSASMQSRLGSRGTAETQDPSLYLRSSALGRSTHSTLPLPAISNPHDPADAPRSYTAPRSSATSPLTEYHMEPIHHDSSSLDSERSRVVQGVNIKIHSRKGKRVRSASNSNVQPNVNLSARPDKRMRESAVTGSPAEPSHHRPEAAQHNAEPSSRPEASL